MFGRYRQLILAMVLIAGVDQGSKALAERLIPSNEAVPLIAGVLDLRLRHNPGVGWGLGSDAPPGVSRVLFPVVSVAVTFGLIWLYRRVSPRERLLQLGLALLIGGGVGNLIDRVRLGSVIDFIAVHLVREGWSMHGTFNVADIVMVVGLIMIAAAVWRRRYSRPETEGGAL